MVKIKLGRKKGARRAVSERLNGSESLFNFEASTYQSKVDCCIFQAPPPPRFFQSSFEYINFDEKVLIMAISNASHFVANFCQVKHKSQNCSVKTVRRRLCLCHRQINDKKKTVHLSKGCLLMVDGVAQLSGGQGGAGDQ